jgi:uncharacterized membrane protein YkoI
MKKLAIWFGLIIGLVAILTTGSPVAVSSENERQWEDDDHAYDRARRAVDRGEVLPIAKLLERLNNEVPGEVIGVEFEREHGRWMYEFKVIDSKGRLLEVYVDAHTGEVLSMEED